MENKEMIVKILMEYGCSTSLQIVGIANREYNVALTPAKVAGAIRPMIRVGEAASDKNIKGATVYWLTDEYKDKLQKEQNMISYTMKVAYCDKPSKNKTIIEGEMYNGITQRV